MRKKHLLLVCLVFLIGLPLQAQIQRGPTREKADYEAAARFSMKKVRKMVFSMGVRPVWFKNSDLFWYTYKTPQGESWYVADPVKVHNKNFRPRTAGRRPYPHRKRPL